MVSAEASPVEGLVGCGGINGCELGAGKDGQSPLVGGKHDQVNWNGGASQRRVGVQDIKS